MTPQEKVKREKQYDHVTAWHNAGITGKGVVVWDMEPITSKEEHGEKTRLRVLDAAPDVTVINAGLVMSYNNDAVKYAYVETVDGKQMPVEDFVRQNNIKILTQSIGGEFCGASGTASAKFWEDLKERYKLIYFNSYGNEGDEQRCEKDKTSILVGACSLSTTGVPTRDYYSFTGKGIDFVDFKGMWNGTSFAAPYLAGKAALLVQKYGHSITQDFAMDYFKSHAVDLQDAGWDTYTGNGIVVMGEPGMTIKIKIGEKSMTVDGQTIKLDQPAIVDQTTYRTLVPVRAIAEVFGAEVSWNQEKQEVAIVK